MGLLFLFSCIVSVRANVYATDIQLNGSLHAGVIVPGGSLAISYILNDNATGGVSARIYSGTNVVKTFTAEGGIPGTNAGLNSFLWDGTNDNGSNALPGIYTLSITAAADGYDTWTNITDDSTNFDVFLPSGITVNKNTNSPYYGRVFIGNTAGTAGILKCNADGSPADEGGFSTGGYSWGGGYYNPSPWKMGVSADDRLYVEDWSGYGLLMSFDQVLSTNYLAVLRPDNYPDSGLYLSGPCVLGAGTNTQIWMAGIYQDPPGLGILRWNVSPDGTLALNDTGAVVVSAGSGCALTYAPFDVAVDTNGGIYAIQRVNVYGSPLNQDTDPATMRVLCFPPYLNGSPPETNAVWQVGSGDPTLENAYGVAVDPAATFVAVACRGRGPDPNGLTNGGISIF
jgi:hypothetical protein